MKTITKVTNGKGFNSTVSITKEYKLTPEHFRVLDILIGDDYPDIYKGVKTERSRMIRYNAIITLSKIGMLGSYLEGDKITHFLSDYGVEIVRKIIKAD
jgi:hypothetical protein